MYKYKGQGRIFLKCGTNFVLFGTKISKKNNLKQKSYKNFGKKNGISLYKTRSDYEYKLATLYLILKISIFKLFFTFFNEYSKRKILIYKVSQGIVIINKDKNYGYLR